MFVNEGATLWMNIHRVAPSLVTFTVQCLFYIQLGLTLNIAYFHLKCTCILRLSQNKPRHFAVAIN